MDDLSQFNELKIAINKPRTISEFGFMISDFFNFDCDHEIQHCIPYAFHLVPCLLCLVPSFLPLKKSHLREDLFQDFQSHIHHINMFIR